MNAIGNQAAIEIDVSVAHRGASVSAHITDVGPIALLLGEPQSGKSALLETLAGFRNAQTGWVRVGGRVLADVERRIHLRPARRAVGYVPTGGALFPHLTVEENLAFGIRRVDESVVRRIEAVIERFRLSAILRRRPRDLTPADRLHAAIGRAIAPGPAWLLIDGPDRLISAEAIPELLGVIADVGPPAIVACEPRSLPTDSMALDWPRFSIERSA